MDQEIIIKQFNEIEIKVEQLIEICKSLEETNLKLRNKIEELEEKLHSKTEVENSYTEERAFIRSKIDGLLARLNEVAEP